MDESTLVATITTSTRQGPQQERLFYFFVLVLIASANLIGLLGPTHELLFSHNPTIPTTTSLTLLLSNVANVSNVTTNLHLSASIISNSNSNSNSNNDTATMSIQRIPTSVTHNRACESYPCWGDATIAFSPLLHILQQVNGTFANPNKNFPIVPYVIDDQYRLWVSQRIRKLHGKQVRRPTMTERFLKQTLDWLRQNNNNNNNHEWPQLTQAIQHHSLPYLHYFGDFAGCNQNNNPPHFNASVPMLTHCTRSDCQSAFPTPTYKLIDESQNTSNDWDQIWEQYHNKYPAWVNKTRQVLWRGTLSGRLHLNSSNAQSNIRWKLVDHVHNHAPNPALYDIGLTGAPRHPHVDLSQVGGTKDFLPMPDFQNYQAILDIDGNSWSSRFGVLLCYNSVVLKVESTFAEYFYPQLRPYEHYVPVRSDLTDLDQQAALVLDPANAAQVQRIIHNANAWCRQNMTKSKLRMEYLNIWNAYAGMLEPNWTDEWKVHKPKLWQDLEMVLV